MDLVEKRRPSEKVRFVGPSYSSEQTRVREERGEVGGIKKLTTQLRHGDNAEANLHSLVQRHPRLPRSSASSIGISINTIQQVPAPRLARNPTQRRKARFSPRRFQAPTKQGLFPPTPRSLVRPLLGPPRLRLRRLRTRPLRHRRLRRLPLLQRHRRDPTGYPGGVHPRKRPGFLRREPGGRLQLADFHNTIQGIWEMQLRRVRQRPQHYVPGGAAGEVTRREEGGGVQERLLCFQLAEVLLHR
ncbi:hypothetical protein L6164_008083 [Bauhinia variegata]|uniref:Uncharacterized protein n=1 Tax=Bauhinia variegata TaxID=167791 RepID=A0ACB9PFJ1_BAUVA|nr:hypothetical protein L6164_008083 [Bauhinia variegata]